MEYLYDLHVHSSECSKCAHSTLVEMVKAYKEAGFAGFAITNHFFARIQLDSGGIHLGAKNALLLGRVY